MPYRDARTPLLQRRAALASELSAVDAELARLRAPRRALPLLDRITIASPCTASWEHMLGDDRARSCGECEREVYDTSAMTAEEAEAFLEQRVGTETCVRLHRRADGTIITRDCAIGAHRRRSRIAVGSVLAMAAAGVMAVGNAEPGERRRPSLGGISWAPRDGPATISARTMALRDEPVGARRDTARAPIPVEELPDARPSKASCAGADARECHGTTADLPKSTPANTGTLAIGRGE